MRRALLAIALAMAVSATAIATTEARGAQGTTGWACVATDDGSANPGPACPGGQSNGYRYQGITNSLGYTTYVNNDMWNPPGAGHPQTIYASSPGDWKVVSDQPAGNTAVLSYPSVQQLFTRSTGAPAPISGFSTLLSNYAESMPAGGDNEAGFDIWLGTSARTAYSQEVMIWVDNHRTNPPPGKVIAHPRFFGVPFTVWADASGTPATIYLLRDSNAPAGRVHIITMLKWLEQHRLSPPGSGINDIEFGWEICSTNSHPWTFTITRYQLLSTCTNPRTTTCWAS
jgi:hypothetical protein